MTGSDLGGVLQVVALGVLLLVVVLVVLVCTTRRVRAQGWLASAALVLVATAAVWFLLSPVQVDGELCTASSAVHGLLADDGVPRTAWSHADPVACTATSRRIAGAWAVAASVAVVAWYAVVRRAPSRDA